MGSETGRFADVAAPTIALGILLGRMGCFLNGCCFGGVTCADCQLAPGVGFPISSPPRDTLVSQGYQTTAGFTLENVHGFVTTRVGQVDPDSAADRAGLEPNDEIRKVNGREITSVRDLNAALGSLEGWPRGESLVTLEVSRPPKGEEGAEETKVITFRPRTLELYPTQLYEVISMVLVGLLLLAYEPFRRNPGQVAAVLMVCYGVHRWLNEILRDDPRPEGLERYGSVILIASGVALWALLQWAKAPAGPVTPVGDAAKKLGITPATPATDAIQGASPVRPGP
jgi:phosphatidylglycerol:prolipoprotein diacylglycerol transferase